VASPKCSESSGRSAWHSFALLRPARSGSRPATRERKPSQPAPKAQRPSEHKAAVSFGDLDAIGKALRAARKARREELEQQAEAFQSPLFDL